MIQADDPGGLARLGDFIRLVVPGKTDGEGLHPVGRVSLGNPCDESRIHAAAEENSDLHVGHELTLYRLLKQESVTFESFPSTAGCDRSSGRDEVREFPNRQFWASEVYLHDVPGPH